jgi:hypothetical protein
MKRSFGLGDILSFAGLVLMFAFVLVAMLYSLTGEGKEKFGWIHVNAIVLMLLVVGAGAMLVFSMMSGNAKLLNILYAFAFFMVALHVALIGVPSYYHAGGMFGMPPMSFYVFVGALLLGVGTYVTQSGMSFGEKGGKKEK